MPTTPLHQVGLNEVKRNRGWFLGLGIVLVLLGTIALGCTFTTTTLLVAILGWLMIFAGATQAIHAFWKERGWAGFFIDALMGVLYLVVGFMVVGNPTATAIMLTLMIGMFLMLEGTFRVFTAISVRYPNWGWSLLNGVVSLALGVMIWRQWPLSGLWVIGLFVGIQMILNGWSFIMLSLAAKNLPDQLRVARPDDVVKADRVVADRHGWQSLPAGGDMWHQWSVWAFVAAVGDLALASGVTVHAVLWKRDSRAVIGWVGLAWLAPFVGALAYLWLGINRIERKAASLHLADTRKSREPSTSPGEIERVGAFERDYPHLVGLANAGRALTGRDLVPGNRCEPLIDGDEAYPAMIGAIEAAERSVALLSYIFDSDRAGDAFLETLLNAKRRGVEVRVLIDDVGAKYGRPNMIGRLKAAGLNVAGFLPTRGPRLLKYANLRNHRKILVVDGKIGFTGGTNIREGHWLSLSPKAPVQCLHFRLEGPVVSQLQQVLANDWAFAAGEQLDGEDWFPAASREGPVWARGIEHGPDEHFEKLADLIAAALASARRRVRILTPYFLPHAALIQALNVAAMRGVSVEVYLPSASNVALVQWAATAQLWQLLEKGCRIFYTPPPFDHTKLMIVDDVWTLIGSTNWDPRSLRLNFEFNVECYDEHLSRTLNQLVDRKVETAREVTLDEVNGRRFPVQLRDGLSRLLTPYL